MEFKKNVLVMMVIACLFSIAASATAAEDKALYGSWEGKVFGKFIYTYSENGKMKLTTFRPGDDTPSLVLEGTYTVNNGKITMKLPSEEGGEIDRELKGTYKINGDILALTADGITTKLKKIKE